MTVNVKDTLKYPLGGLVNATIRLVTVENSVSTNVLPFSQAEYQVIEGKVDFLLEDGVYDFFVKYTDTFEHLCQLVVDEFTPAIVTLNQIRFCPLPLNGEIPQ